MTEDSGVEREEVEKLLPWYVTGKLGRADTSKVENYLAEHPDVSAQLDLVRAEREQTVRANEALGMPSPSGIDRLTASLPPARPSFFGCVTAGSWAIGFAKFFAAPTTRGVRWAAIVAAVLILAQSAVITTLLLRAAEPADLVASGPSQSDGLPVLVVFSDDAKAAAIAQLLAEFEATIVDGPKPGGVYKIRLRIQDTSRRAKEALLRKLAERRDIIRIVLPTRD